MDRNQLYCVTNWSSYRLVEAACHHSAVRKVYGDKNFRLIPDSELTEDTVTHAMSCEYKGRLARLLESCSIDVDRVLVMNTRPETKHFQLSD